MNARIGVRATVSALTMAALVAASLLGAAPASAITSGVVVDVYDTIPDVLPPNVSSHGFQAQRTSELGQLVALSEAGGTLDTVEVGFSTWACESGAAPVCVTTPGATFQHPITVTVYEVVSGAPGPVLASTTETVDVPYRPSASRDPAPTGCGASATAWYSPVAPNCFNGMLFSWEFDFSAAGVTLPAEVIVSVAFNTKSWGAAPIGASGPYESLNVALRGQLTVGTLPDPDQVFWNSTFGGRLPGFAPATGWGTSGPIMLTISTYDPAPPPPPVPPAPQPAPEPAPQPAPVEPEPVVVPPSVVPTTPPTPVPTSIPRNAPPVPTPAPTPASAAGPKPGGFDPFYLLATLVPLGILVTGGAVFGVVAERRRGQER